MMITIVLNIVVDAIINYIVNLIDEQYTVYSDLTGHTAPGELCVTAQKPDINLDINIHGEIDAPLGLS